MPSLYKYCLKLGAIWLRGMTRGYQYDELSTIGSLAAIPAIFGSLCPTQPERVCPLSAHGVSQDLT